MKRAQLRDASSTGVILALGVLVGVGGSLIVERMARVSYEPPEFAQAALAAHATERTHPYRNCDEAAGDAPLHLGEPDYGDGIACEPLEGD